MLIIAYSITRSSITFKQSNLPISVSVLFLFKAKDKDEEKKSKKDKSNGRPDDLVLQSVSGA